MLEKAAEATEYMIKLLSDGASVDWLCRKAEEELADNGYKITAFGYGIGAEVVEKPIIMRGSGQLIRKGMVLCIEPRVEARGGKAAQVEDMVVASDAGARVLTKAPITR